MKTIGPSETRTAPLPAGWLTRYSDPRLLEEAGIDLSMFGQPYSQNEYDYRMNLATGTSESDNGPSPNWYIYGPGSILDHAKTGTMDVAYHPATQSFSGIDAEGRLIPNTNYSYRTNDDAAMIAGILAIGGALSGAGAGAAAGSGSTAAAGGSTALTASEAAALEQVLTGAGTGSSYGAAAGSNALSGAWNGTDFGGAVGAGSGASAGAAGGNQLLSGVSNASLVNAGLQLGSAYLGSNAIGNATDAQLAAGRDSNALLREMWLANRADNQPLVDLRNSVLPRISGLLSDPSSITSDPGYQFGLNQGNKLLQNRAAAAGNYYSGQQLKAAQQYGQDYAGTKMDQTMNRYMGAAGLGQLGSTANQSTNSSYGTQASNNLMNMGNVRGSGYVGNANAWGNALGNIGNDWMNQYYLNKLNGG